MHVEALGWTPSGTLRILDQTLLPAEERWLEIATREGLVEAIRGLRVRGAPALGIAAAMGLVAILRSRVADDRDAFLATVDRLAEEIAGARPTAMNLGWAMDRMRRRARAAEGGGAAPGGAAAGGGAAASSDAPTAGGADGILAVLREEAQAIWDEDRAMCRAIAEHGQALMRPGVRVLTHCNTGALATGGIGTALGIVYRAAERGLDPHVWVDETRPLWQGSRLTAWELSRAGVRHTVLPDSAAGSLMAEGQVDVVLVGADRIARNGDVANKLGTYPLAVLARHHGVAFYSVAPSTSFDPACASGRAIPIEQRSREEVAAPCGVAVAPADSPVLNPAFDVTPAALVTGYVTERGFVRPPFEGTRGVRCRGVLPSRFEE